MLKSGCCRATRSVRTDSFHKICDCVKEASKATSVCRRASIGFDAVHFTEVPEARKIEVMIIKL